MQSSSNFQMGNLCCEKHTGFICIYRMYRPSFLLKQPHNICITTMQVATYIHSYLRMYIIGNYVAIPATYIAVVHVIVLHAISSQSGYYVSLAILAY